jgi:hypothetical protein
MTHNRRRAAAAALTSALLLAAGPSASTPARPAPSGLPQEAIAAGYTKLIFDENFDRLDLSPDGAGNHRWYNQLWFQKPVDPEGRMKVRGGVLTVAAPYGIKSVQLETFAPKPGGRSTLFQYGYIEARIRYDFNTGGGSTFWMESEVATWHRLRKKFSPYCEIDIIEPQRGIRYGFSVHDFYALHRSNETPKDFRAHHPLTNAEEWTRYGVLWQPDRITFFRNGVAQGSVPAPQTCKDQRLFLVIGAQKHDGTGTQDAQFDWVRVWR